MGFELEEVSASPGTFSFFALVSLSHLISKLPSELHYTGDAGRVFDRRLVVVVVGIQFSRRLKNGP